MTKSLAIRRCSAPRTEHISILFSRFFGLVRIWDRGTSLRATADRLEVLRKSEAELPRTAELNNMYEYNNVF